MKITRKLFALLLLFGIFTFASCKKEKEPDSYYVDEEGNTQLVEKNDEGKYIVTDDEEPEEFMDEFLDRLPPDYRVVIHLFYYEDISTADISRILGKKESTVRMQLTRARRLLKEFMKGDEVNV